MQQPHSLLVNPFSHSFSCCFSCNNSKSISRFYWFISKNDLRKTVCIAYSIQKMCWENGSIKKNSVYLQT